MNLLLFFLADEWMLVLIVGVGLALMLGIVRVGWAFGFILSIAIIYSLSPFIDSLIGGLIDSLDLWVLIVLMILFGFYILRIVLTPVLGSEGAGAFLGHAFYDLVLFPFRILGGLIRLLL